MVDPGIYFGIVAFVSWGIADFFAKKAVDSYGAHRNLIYQAVIGLALMAAVALVLQPAISLTPVTVLILLGTGLTGIIGLAAFTQGLVKGRVSIVSAVASTNPLITVSLAILLLGEFLTPLQMLAAVLIIASSSLVSIEKDGVKLKKSDHGVLYGAIAAVLWGIAIFLYAAAIPVAGWLIGFLVARSFGVTGLALWAIVKRPNLKPTISGLRFSGIAGFFEIIGLAALGLGLERAFASLVAPVAAAFPAVTVVLAAIFLHERLRSYHYVAIAGILAGLVLISL